MKISTKKNLRSFSIFSQFVERPGLNIGHVGIFNGYNV